MFLDFQAIKRLASLRDVVAWLGLDVKNNRCQCPVNEGDTREMVFTFDKGIWHCFGCKKKVDPRTKTGGDQIELVAHVLQVDAEAGRQRTSAKRFHGYAPAQKGLPESGLDYLEAEHEAVQALGISPEKAVQLGIGYAPRGTMVKRVLFPSPRQPRGNCSGYLGRIPRCRCEAPEVVGTHRRCIRLPPWSVSYLDLGSFHRGAFFLCALTSLSLGRAAAIPSADTRKIFACSLAECTRKLLNQDGTQRAFLASCLFCSHFDYDCPPKEATLDKYLITRRSENIHTGPIMVTTSPRVTCPFACPLRRSATTPTTAAACYAEHGALGGFVWTLLDRLPVGGSYQNGNIKVYGFDELLFVIRSLPPGSLWRHNVAGDLTSNNRSTIDHLALKLLTEANRVAAASPSRTTMCSTNLAEPRSGQDGERRTASPST